MINIDILLTTIQDNKSGSVWFIDGFGIGFEFGLGFGFKWGMKIKIRERNYI
jgi:hypothetical protein